MSKYIKLVAWILSFQLMSAALGWLMKGSVDGWYQTLVRSPFSPPGYIFGIVWPILYLMIAVSGWLLWNAKDSGELQSVKKLYIVQMLLNWSWTPLFFYYKSTALPLCVISLMLVLVGLLIMKSYEINKNASVLLVPYFIWLSFASYLNFYMWMNN